MITNVRGYDIDIEKVKDLATRSGFPEVRAYHERSLGLIENALAGCELNPKQKGWLNRLSENVENQHREELGK